MKKIFVFFLVLFFFNACTVKNQNYHSQSVSIIINSPFLKMRDFGFLKRQNQILILEVYRMGQAFFNLKIKDKICLNIACYDKQIFNKKFFKNEYYDDILSDILNAKPLWQGKNLQKTTCGFKQNLKTENFEIFYEVCQNKVSFLDKISHIKIVLAYQG
ncbi:hypothetical protein [Campylobacter estrildidarum]|uniref:Lipoprotein n=1 Tax=Campylobacter estrildidarum TaxID=2510189 RepID=A0A4U7BII8_9BACT|nr:hypothetical protein [Campylobacter estrildidarum]TKX31309.1 hypothetical protein CQA69_03440 [Campylobacter estrildidarum]